MEAITDNKIEDGKDMPFSHDRAELEIAQNLEKS